MPTSGFVVATAFTPTSSPARVGTPLRTPVRVGLVQHRWLADPDQLRDQLLEGVRLAVAQGARAVFLPELTLSRYPADVRAGTNPGDRAEDLLTGPTFRFAAHAATENGVLVHSSLYERADAADGLGYNTAILVSPSGELVGRTRKLHIPVTAGYYENTY
ncbi:hydrolase, partial [Mycobacteroides abscessus]